MTGDERAIAVADEPGRSRYELRVDGELAGLIDYRERAGVRVLVHTEVVPAHEGEGLGSLLVRAVLDDLRGRGLLAVPSCPFVAAYIRRHLEYADLVPAAHGS